MQASWNLMWGLEGRGKDRAAAVRIASSLQTVTQGEMRGKWGSTLTSIIPPRAMLTALYRSEAAAMAACVPFAMTPVRTPPSEG